MKIISLNIWGGRIANPLNDFIKKHSDVDVFLLQEVIDPNLDFMELKAGDRAKVGEILIEHNSFYRPANSNGFGLASFIKKDIQVIEEGEIFIHRERGSVLGDKWWRDIGKNLQYLKIKDRNGLEYTLFNYHGLWDALGKIDTPDRVKQSEGIVGFLSKFSGNRILCGDFNLTPESDCLKLITEKLDFKNLITEFDIKSTRTSLYTRDNEQYADYIFVPKDLTVKKFEVFYDEMSDHAALFLEI